MQLPQQAMQLSLMGPARGPYPPRGFIGFYEHELGNGDHFGLYWPLGREQGDPLVCEVWHDSWELIPKFSCLDRFLEAPETSDEGDWIDEPTLRDDPQSPSALLRQAQEDAGQNRLDKATERLELAVRVLPEYAAAWSTLAASYRRLKRTDDALVAIHRALLAPPCFGRPGDGLVHWYRRQTTDDERLRDDPYWLRRADLKFTYGGTKENDDYQILLTCIDAYQATGAGVRAVLLYWRYAFLMAGETTAFQDRYQFSQAAFEERQRRMLVDLIGDHREIVVNE